MKIRRPTFLTHGQNRLPAFAQLFLVLAIGVASIGTGRLFPEQLTQIRQHVDDFFLPIHQLADAPIQTVQNLTSLATTLQHNIKLREELLQLQEWKTHAFALAYENEQLRDLLGVRTPQSLAITNRLDGMILARAVADRSAAGTRNLLLDKGEIDGITIDDVVFSNGALVGRIIQVGLHSSRLRLITDLQSRIPVIIGEARHRAVLFGDGSDQPVLQFLEHGATLKAGQLVITSGGGGLFRPGLPIGYIAKAGLAFHAQDIKAKDNHEWRIRWLGEMRTPTYLHVASNQKIALPQ